MLIDGLVEYGYWNVAGSPAGLQPLPLIPGANDLPAVKVTISKDSGRNGGAIQLFLAKILGIDSVPLSATAVAAVCHVLVTLNRHPFSNSYHTMHVRQLLGFQHRESTELATTAHPPGFDLPQTVGQPYVFKITSSYHTGPCEAGQWTSLDIDSNNVPTIRNIITNGNQGKISIRG